MRFLAILGVFILTVLPTFGQQQIMGFTFGHSIEELQKGNEILASKEIKATCVTLTETPNGTYIGIRNEKNVPINFLYKDGKLNQVPALDRYTIFGYLKTKNSLIVTSYNSRNSDIISDGLFTYDLSLSRVNYKIHDKKHGEIYNATVKGDTVVCLINVKRINQVGSDIEPKLIIF